MKRKIRLVLVILLASLLFTPAATVLADDGGQDAIVGGSYILKSGDRRSTDLTVIGGQVELQGQSLVEGNVVIVGGEAAIDGEVRGDVVALGGQVTLGQTAIIDGDLVIFGTVRRHADAQVKGNTVEGLRLDGISEYMARIYPGRLESQTAPLPVKPATRPREAGRAAGSLVTLLVTLGATALVMMLLPTQVGRAGHAMQGHALLSLATGGLTTILVLILLPILIVLCLGIPFAIVLAIAFILCGVMGWAAAGRMAGRKILRALRSGGASPLAETLLGTLAITLLSLVPCLGYLFATGVLFWGVGGTVLTRLGTSVYPPEATWVTRPAAAQQSPAQTATTITDNTTPPEHRGRDTHPLSEKDIWGQ